jgi:signal transduction histidine kinase
VLYVFLFRPLIVEMHHRKQTERSKDEFLSILPHELRTPLTTMREGIDQVVGGHLGPVTPAQTECLQVVGQGVERLNRMFDKVVSVAHLLANTVEYTFEPVPMTQVMDALAKRLQPVAKQNGVTLRVDHDTQLPSCVVDAGRIVEALGEIVENSIAVTPTGRQVVLSCRAKFGGVELSVQDEGPGIVVEELPAFFDRLHAVGGIDERKTGGLGLGLSIARAIINAHGGAISVSSTPGAGTCVVISIKPTPKRKGKVGKVTVT